MRLVLALLTAVFVAIANASAIYNLTDEFTASCAVICVSALYEDSNPHCDYNDVACWCRSPTFVSNTGCCITSMCDEDISQVKSTFSAWCSAAHAQAPNSTKTDCSKWNPFASIVSSLTGSGSSSSSSGWPLPTMNFDNQDNSNQDAVPLQVKVGISLGVVATLALTSLWVYMRSRRRRHLKEVDFLPLTRVATQAGVGASAEVDTPARVYLPPRAGTPPPPYSAEAPQLNRSKDDPSPSSSRFV